MKAINFDRRAPAHEMLVRRRAWRIDDTHYEVVGREAKERYAVTLEPGGNLTCSCTAGHYGRPCWHEAKVARRLLRDGIADGVLDVAPDDQDEDDDVWGRL